jgi:hypothetical protein
MTMATAIKPPERRPLPDHLAQTAFGAALAAVVTDLLVAALATSRADAHVLSPLAATVIVAVAAATGVIIGWPNGLYGGANDVLTGTALLGCEPGCRNDPPGDPWQPARLLRATLLWLLVVAVWAAASAALLAVALNGKHVRVLVLFVALAGIAGVASVVVDTVARHRGAHAARAVALSGTTPHPLRRTAWLRIALPLGLAVALTSGLFSWVLFHDFRTGSAAAAGGPKALTHSAAFADVGLTVILLSVLFGYLISTWGSVDARLGRISLEEPAAQDVPPKSLIGVQGIVYVAVAGIVLGRIAEMVLPSTPSLLAVGVARGLFAGGMAFLAAGFAYVRGATNGRAVPAEVLV